MAGLGRRQRDPHRFGIAHLADDDDVGRLANRGAQRRRKIRRVDADLDLLDQTAVVLVLVLDRILDRHDVPGVAPVDLLDDRRERRRLARSGRPADEHQPARQLREQLDRRRQPERRQSRHCGRQQPNRRRRAAALAMQVDAEAADAGDAKRGVGDARVAILPPRVRSEGRQHRLLDVEPVERPLGERDDLAVDADRRRRARHEQQVAAAA